MILNDLKIFLVLNTCHWIITGSNFLYLSFPPAQEQIIKKELKMVRKLKALTRNMVKLADRKTRWTVRLVNGRVDGALLDKWFAQVWQSRGGVGRCSAGEKEDEEGVDQSDQVEVFHLRVEVRWLESYSGRCALPVGNWACRWLFHWLQLMYL